jgi:hypothetical protein
MSNTNKNLNNSKTKNTNKKKINKNTPLKAAGKVAPTPAKILPNQQKPIPVIVKGVGKYKTKKVPEKSYGWWDLAGDALPLFKKGAQLLGFGDYEVKSNSIAAQATEGQIGSQIPQIINSKYSNIVRHREYIGKVLGSTGAFTIVDHAINPGNNSLFPWLSIQAKGYQRYRWRGLIFEYIPLSADYAANTAMGYVAMATQYNVLENVFGNKRDMMQYEFSNEDKPSKVIMHPVECASDQNTVTEFYVRDGDQAVTGDQRLADIGRFTIATGGNPAADGYLGDLYASYEVEFFQPRGAQAEGGFAEGCEASVTTSVGNLAPLGQPVDLVIDAGSTLVVKTLGGLILRIPSGYKHVFVHLRWLGGSATNATATITPVNCTITYIGGASNGFLLSGSASTTYTWTGFLTSSDIDAVMDIQFGTGGTFPTSPTLFINIMQVPDYSNLPTLKADFDRFNSKRVPDNSVPERISANDILLKLVSDGILSIPKTDQMRIQTETESVDKEVSRAAEVLRYLELMSKTDV